MSDVGVGGKSRAEAQSSGAEWALLPWLDLALARSAAMSRSHAILAHGPAGVGQLPFALAVGRGLLCEDATLGRPCTRCASCRLARTHVHPDLQVVLADARREQLGWPNAEGESRGDSKPSREIRIAQVRAAIAWGQQTPARGGVKVLVVHPADALNDASASALLKTLEEPPKSLRIVLTSADPDHLLPTVRSRCQMLRLSNPDVASASAWLESHGVERPDAVLSLAGGSPLLALELAGEGIDRAWIVDLPQRLRSADSSPLAGRPVARVVDLLLKLACDLGTLTVGGVPRFFPAGALTPPTDAAALLQWQRELFRIARHADHPWHAALLVEATVTAASRIWQPRRGRSRERPDAASLHSAS